MSANNTEQLSGTKQETLHCSHYGKQDCRVDGLFVSDPDKNGIFYCVLVKKVQGGSQQIIKKYHKYIIKTNDP